MANVKYMSKSANWRNLAVVGQYWVIKHQRWLKGSSREFAIIDISSAFSKRRDDNPILPKHAAVNRYCGRHETNLRPANGTLSAEIRSIEFAGIVFEFASFSGEAGDAAARDHRVVTNFQREIGELLN